MNTWADLLSFGRHSLYVWASLALCGLALVIEVRLLRARRRAWAKDATEVDAGAPVRVPALIRKGEPT